MGKRTVRTAAIMGGANDNSEPTLADLIERKRAAGPDREFEELLSKPWVCPHCHHRATILTVLIPVGDPSRSAMCPKCEKEGIEPFELTEDLQ